MLCCLLCANITILLNVVLIILIYLKKTAFCVIIHIKGTKIKGKERANMDTNFETLKISTEKDNSQKVREIMAIVYDALMQKGYNPLNQIVAYLMSGDPTYITGHNNARILISRLERDEIMEEFAKEYLKTL